MKKKKCNKCYNSIIKLAIATVKDVCQQDYDRSYKMGMWFIKLQILKGTKKNDKGSN